MNLRVRDPLSPLTLVETRLGQMHARQRLATEREHEAKALGKGFTFLHIQSMSIKQMMIEVILRATGTYWRGHANAGKAQLRRNDVRLPRLPEAFDGFTILHLSDLHADMSASALEHVAELVLGCTDGRLSGGDLRRLQALPRGRCSFAGSVTRRRLCGAGKSRFPRHGSRPGGARHSRAAERKHRNRARRGYDLPCRGGRRAFLPHRRCREGSGAHSEGQHQDIALTYPRDLWKGSERRFRPDVERTYAWRADLPAWLVGKALETG
jgi:hypothetical protein